MSAAACPRTHAKKLKSPKGGYGSLVASCFESVWRGGCLRDAHRGGPGGVSGSLSLALSTQLRCSSVHGLQHYCPRRCCCGGTCLDRRHALPRGQLADKARPTSTVLLLSALNRAASQAMSFKCRLPPRPRRRDRSHRRGAYGACLSGDRYQAEPPGGAEDPARFSPSSHSPRDRTAARWTTR